MPQENLPNNDAGKHWAMEWLTAVADGSKPMSQRNLAMVEKRGGGLEKIEVVAQALGVHLLLLEHNNGDKFLIASKKPFKVIC